MRYRVTIKYPMNGKPITVTLYIDDCYTTQEAIKKLKLTPDEVKLIVSVEEVEYPTQTGNSP